MLSVYVSLPVWPAGLHSTQYNLTKPYLTKINKQTYEEDYFKKVLQSLYKGYTYDVCLGLFLYVRRL